MGVALAGLLLAAPGVSAQIPGPMSPANLPSPVPPVVVSQPSAFPPGVVVDPVTPSFPPGPPPPTGDVKPPAPPAPKFEATWNNGLFFHTANKEFSAHVGGVVHLDSAWYAAPNSLQTFPGGTGRFTDGATPRRLRLFAEGTAYKNFDYLFAMEFANGQGPVGSTGAPLATNTFTVPGVLDAWVTVRSEERRVGKECCR